MVTRAQAKTAHRILVSNGCYRAAARVLALLLGGRVSLGLSEPDWIAECALVEQGALGTTANGDRMVFRMSH